ncbi:hypothetical protein ACO1O0_006703, partial [Amphichorda felina]
EGCEIARSETEGQSVSVSASISGNGWISAGFEVSEYEESGETQACSGNRGETICVFWRAAYTAYTVQRQPKVCCEIEGDPVHKVITSPNKNGLGSAAICGRNRQCHSKGHSYWNNMERQNKGATLEGGPQEWHWGNKYLGIVPDIDEV